MLSVTVEGAVNLLEAFNPRKFILASSCAIYGNTGALAALPTWKRVNPVSVYGVSKAAAELVVGHWAKETGNVAINLRIGNVIGKGCRGLIAYLVRHAVRRPRGFPPAQLRGAGKIVRDYVPRDHVVRVIMAAADTEWEAGTVNTFNVGAGRGLTNREVASVVQKLLRERGYELNIHWDAEPAAGESWAAALNVDSTERRFGIPSPTAEAVYEAIHEATIFCLEESVRAAEGAHSAYSATQALS
jgi:nucleoside-diphosphate-sugar epimerase